MVVGFALWKAGLISPIMTDMIRYRAPLMKIKPSADLTDIDADDTLKHWRNLSSCHLRTAETGGHYCNRK